MKRLSLVLGLTAGVLGLTHALAQPYPRPPAPGFPGNPPPAPYGQPVPARQAERPGMPERPPYEQRMSPEERRQLRRDIEQHGREIYPEPRRQGRR